MSDDESSQGSHDSSGDNSEQSKPLGETSHAKDDNRKLDGENELENEENGDDSDDETPSKKVKEGGEAEIKEKKKKKSKSVFGDKFLAQAENFTIKLKKRGVIYVARVPPRMTPTKLKSLLSEFGEITRVYLVEEDKSFRQRRRKQGGSGAKRYTEGWVEFAKKRIAKNVALSLNNTQISNYKRSHHFGE